MGAVGIAVAIGGCGGGGSKATSEPAKTETMTVIVSISWDPSGLDCADSPLEDGLDMVVENGHGDMIGVVRFDKSMAGVTSCDFTGHASVSTTVFYKIKASDGQLFKTLSLAELDKDGWLVEIPT